MPGGSSRPAPAGRWSAASGAPPPRRAPGRMAGRRRAAAGRPPQGRDPGLSPPPRGAGRGLPGARPARADPGRHGALLLRPGRNGGGGGGLEAKGILARSTGRDALEEEMPEAYKDVREVVEVVERFGISKRVARLRPMGVIKGESSGRGALPSSRASATLIHRNLLQKKGINVLGAEEKGAGPPGVRAGRDRQGLGGQDLGRPGLPKHVLRRHVQPRLPDRVRPPQSPPRRRLRAGLLPGPRGPG